jgi:hypothetical protein
MNPETVSTITTWMGLITLTVAAVGSIIVIAIAVVQSLKSRVVRWDALIFAVVLLWALPYGIRIYGPELVDATIDLLNNLAGKREPMEDAITRFIGDVNEELPVVPDVPTVIIATPEFTATPFPTPSVNFAATATAYFESHPTAVPPQPTATLEPTRYVCRTIQDIQAGCTPPTPPVPGK